LKSASWLHPKIKQLEQVLLYIFNYNHALQKIKKADPLCEFGLRHKQLKKKKRTVYSPLPQVILKFSD